MSRKLIAQSFSTNNEYIPTKVELYLKPVGSSGNAFYINNNQDTIIDSCNFIELKQGHNYITVNDSGSFSGIGYIKSNGNSLGNPAKVTYPYLGQNEGTYNLWLRVNGNVNIEILIDNKNYKSINQSYSNWTWISVPLVIFDNLIHNLSIELLSDNCQIDNLYITATNNVPTGIGPSISTSPYATIIVKIANTINNIPQSCYNVLAYKTTEQITNDRWYSFSIEPLDGTIITNNNLCVIVSASGLSNNLYVIWDISANYTLPVATKSGINGWALTPLQSMSLRVYSDIDNLVDEYNCEITTPPALVIDNNIQDMSNPNLSGLLNNTNYIQGYEGQKVELNLGDKLVNVIVDQSGSMTWNDSTNTRFAIDNVISDVLSIKYPGNIRYNLFEFKGQETFSFFLGLTEKLTDLSISSIIGQGLINDPSHFYGIRVIRRKEHYSLTPIDGEIVFDGYALASLDAGLINNTDYYYTVYTYDNLYRFSRGIQIKATTNIPIFPYGIAWFQGQVLKGYDLKADQYMTSLWPTDEGQGENAFNFTSSNLTLSLQNIDWLNINSVPTGNSGLRFNGINSQATCTSGTILTFNPNSSFSIYFWINPFSDLSKSVVLTNGTSSQLNYAVIIDNGYLKFTFDGTNFYTCTTAITNNQWTHIAITYNNGTFNFYQNGSLINSGYFNPINISSYSGSSIFTLGYDSAGFTRFNNRFFGEISHISLHNTERSLAEIQAAATPSQKTDNNGNPVAVDNGDRIVVSEIGVPDDYNYSKIRILLNGNHVPNNENDGIIVFESSNITTGKSYVSASYPYDLTETYYFSVFTQNSLGNWCDIYDASNYSISIPDIDRTTSTLINGSYVVSGPGVNTSIEFVNMIENRPGNAKVWFSWNKPSLPTTRVKIYYSTVSFPAYDQQSEDISGQASIIFDSESQYTEFIHRNLTNGQIGYYAIIPFDRYGSFADPSKWILLTETPLAQLDDTGIPLLEVGNLQYHIFDENRIQLRWQEPISLPNTFSGWFDDQFYVYGAICDIYGNPLTIEVPNNFQITSTIGKVNENPIEDVFNLGLNTSSTQQIPISNFSINGGLITGSIRLQSNPLLDIITSIGVSVSGIYNYSNTFSYSMPSFSIQFNNPLSLTLTNRDNLYLETKYISPPGGCTLDSNSGEGTKVNGIHAGATNPFTIRAFFTYKGQAVNSANIFCNIYDSTGGPCSISPIDYTGSTSTTVTLNTGTFSINQQSSPILDQNGNPTGYFNTVSYADIPISAPTLPESATAYVRCDSSGFTGLAKMNMYFPGTLQLNINATAPIANNIDSVEQFATAYFLNPDNPSDSSLNVPVDDGTIAQWTISPVVVPFYSIDDVPLTTGIYSYFRGGTARDIFFGPANPTQAGPYTITVSTTANGLFATASATVNILGSGGSNSFQNFIPDPTLPRILAEFENTVNYLWADGIDYQKMTISRNPNISTTKYSAKFIECSAGDIFPLPIGTTLYIEAPGYQIITGNVIESIDQNGNKYLITTNATINTDSTTVTVGTNQYIYVYFTINKFISSGSCSNLNKNNNCCAFDAPDQICFPPYYLGSTQPVIVSAKINFAGQPVTIYGGGDFTNDGRPPCLLVPVEPLYVNYLGLYENGVAVSNFTVDNSTISNMYFDIKYKGNIITAGTPFPAYACNLNPSPPLSAGETCRNINSQVGVPNTVYVYNTYNLPGGIVDTNLHSLINIPIGPLNPNENISLGVYTDISFTDGVPTLLTSSSSSSSSSS